MSKSLDVIALAILAAGESAHALSAFEPSAFTIKNWVLCTNNQAQMQQNIANLRSGYVPAALFGVGLGAVISVIAKSPLPLLFAAGTTLGMIHLYERALPPELRLKGPLDIFMPPPEAAAKLPERVSF